MKKLLLFIIFLFSLNLFCNAQKYTAVVLNKEKNSALQYVNIGIVGKNIGTVSDENGIFFIEIDEKQKLENIKFSMIGFEDLQYKVEEFIKICKNEKQFYLTPKMFEFEEIKIWSKKYKKKKILGSKTKSKNIAACTDTFKLGEQIGILIKLKNKESYLKKFNASLTNNSNNNYKFRLNIFEIENGLPTKSILKENVYVDIKKMANDITFDLSKYSLVTNKDFYVGLEFIEENDMKGLCFSAGFFGNNIALKNGSQANWEIYKIFTIGFNVEVLQ